MPTHRPFDAGRHEKYMNARDNMGNAIVLLRQAKLKGGGLIDPRIRVIAEMLLRDLEETLRKATNMQAGQKGEFQHLDGAHKALARSMMAYDTANRFSLGLVDTQGKDELAENARKALSEAFDTIKVAYGYLDDVVAENRRLETP